MTQAKTPKVGNWGRWGPEDERGTLNFITPEVLLKALRVPKQGKFYSLGLPIQQTGVPFSGPPIRLPPLHLMSVDGGDWAGGSKPRGGVKVADDYLFMALGSGSAIEALCHLWIEDHMYNGVSGNLVKSSGARRLGVENVKGIVTRGILLDMPAFKGVHHFDSNLVFSRQDVEECARAEGLEVRAGDAVLIRTGSLALWDGKNEHPAGGRGGISVDVANWLVEKEAAVVGADNGVEATRPEDTETGKWLPMRVELIRNRGMNLLENLYLEELARDRVYEMLLMVAPLNITGATHSPINPIAVS